MATEAAAHIEGNYRIHGAKAGCGLAADIESGQGGEARSAPIAANQRRCDYLVIFSI